MPDAPSRKWLQIHLSTAVLLMLAMGGLMFANMRGRLEAPLEAVIKERIEKRGRFYANAGEFLHVTDDFSTAYKNCNYGWPLDAVSTYVNVSVAKNGDITKHPGQPRIYNGWPINLDLLIALSILAGIAVVCEWWIGLARKGT